MTVSFLVIVCEIQFAEAAYSLGGVGGDKAGNDTLRRFLCQTVCVCDSEKVWARTIP